MPRTQQQQAEQVGWYTELLEAQLDEQMRSTRLLVGAVTFIGLAVAVISILWAWVGFSPRAAVLVGAAAATGALSSIIGTLLAGRHLYGARQTLGRLRSTSAQEEKKLAAAVSLLMARLDQLEEKIDANGESRVGAHRLYTDAKALSVSSASNDEGEIANAPPLPASSSH